MPPTKLTYRFYTYVLCFFLTYVLLLSPSAIFILSGARAEPDTKRKESSSSSTPVKPQAERRDGELLVRFHPNVAAQSRTSLVDAVGAQSIGKLRGRSQIEKLRVPVGQDVETVAAQLRQSPLVEFAEPNYLIKSDELSPNDPRFAEQWGLNADAGVGATTAWETTTGASSTVIAIIDSGVDFNHPDLGPNIWTDRLEQANNRDDDRDGMKDDLHGWDWVANSGEIKDEQGHGTAIAGIIAAQGNDGVGVAGVMWSASLMSLRVLDGKGTGEVASAVEAIDFAVAHGAQVINCSWGTDGFSLALKDAIARAGRRGVVVVAAAGNSGRDIDSAPRYPASFNLPNLLSVNSLDNSARLATWSNWGQSGVTIAAPGSDILTTQPGGDYGLVTGSSASAAFVSGVAGLIKTLRPRLGAERTKELIVQGAKPLAELGGKTSTRGALNAAAAMGAVNTLAPNEGRENAAEPGDSQSAGNRAAYGNGLNDMGDSGSTLAPPPKPGAPGSNLPNLDTVRRLRPVSPAAPPPIPSTRCGHQNRNCASKGTAANNPSLVGRMSHGKASARRSLPATKLASSTDTSVPVSTDGNSFQPILDSSSAPDPSMNLLKQHGPGAALLNLFPVLRALLPPQSSTQDVVWTSAVGVSVSGNSLTKTAGAGWNAGAISTATLASGDGYVEMTATLTDKDRLIGLSNGDTNQSYDDIDFAIRAYLYAGIYIHESGTNKGYFGTYAVGDKLRVAVESGVVKYYKISGGVTTLLYTSAVAPTYPLLVDSALYETNSVISGAVVSDSFSSPSSAQNVIWTNPVGVSTSTNNLTKTGTTAGFNAGASSTMAIASGDGYAEMTASETNTDRLFGLSVGDTDQNYNDIDFAIRPYVNGTVYIHESGTNRGSFGSYAVGDKLRVAVESGVVKYYKISGGVTTLLYTSGLTPSYPLNVDTSLYTTGATVTNAKISGNLQSGNQPGVSAARLDPNNRTGRPGEDMLSRNMNWGVQLVGLPGRSGLDLGLSLSYNSLVWTKDKTGPFIRFDADGGFPAPGFRLGFPVIEQRFYNSETAKNTYLMVLPSGGRVELRETGTPNVYESADSSYMQLTESGNTLTVLTKDGTRHTYLLINSAYRCTTIKDGDGNFITATYDTAGRIRTVVDTLERTLSFEYDTYQNLLSIQQSWTRDAETGLVTETHTWASFGWTNLTIQTNFSGLTLQGVQNNQIIPVLTQVGLADGSHYNFEYTSWGQVKTIKHHAPVDQHLLSYVSYNMNISAGQTDCPRFTVRRDWAAQWNGDTDGVPATSEEAVTTFSEFNPVNNSGAEMTLPDGTLYKEFFATSGWERGLLTRTEVLSNGLKKWTVLTWTQDNTNLAYQLNPRVTESNVYDSEGKRRRTKVDYTSFGLPSDVYEYAADAATVLRRMHMDYNLNTAYTSRRIIGLVSEKFIYGRDPLDNTEKLYSRVKYTYDEGGAYLVDQGVPVQYDSANYGASFVVGRGLVTSVKRVNVNNPSEETTVSRIGYNTTGSPIFSRDALNRQVTISYTDSFSATVGVNTLAYPTQVTDQDNYSSTTKYNYSMGVVVRTQDPKAAVNTAVYDTAGRIELVTNQFNQAFKRWVYGSYYMQTYSSVVNVGNADYFIEVYDGAGRVRNWAAYHPYSTGQHRAQHIIYDVMGRDVQKSNPTEISAAWVPMGDDAGWVYTSQQYDWNGRPTTTTNTDGTTVVVDYTGCGCAGSDVTTISGELLADGRRKQKIYKDVLGRVEKTESLNWDGSVYSTVKTAYNALDQAMRVREYAGTESSGTYQDTLMTYDGHARLATHKVPSQTAASTYAYYTDDRMQSMTDARGASATYTYFNRPLVQSITFDTPPNSGITEPAAASYTYDAAGNRTGMTDGTGSTSYHYNTISRLTSETRTFTNVGSFTITYDYNLGGQLKSLTDPSGAQVTYNHDITGRVQSITGSGATGTVTYADTATYRAWNGLRSVAYGNGKSLAVNYNSRLQPTSFFIPGVLSKAYQYNADGQLRYSQDVLNDKFDRSYTYDQLGRVRDALSGPAARGLADTDARPYKQTYSYDAFNHLTQVVGAVWNGATAGSLGPYTYVNDRRNLATYDADGRVIYGNGIQYTIDARGSVIRAVGDTDDQQMTYDGDGQRVKMETTWEINLGGELETSTTTRYELRSSVLDQVINELDENGQKVRGFVYDGGSVLAVQTVSGTTQSVHWSHTDVSGASYRTTTSTGAVQGLLSAGEMDPLNRNARTQAPPSSNPPRFPIEYKTYPGFSDILTGGCELDGIPILCDLRAQLLEGGAVSAKQITNAPPPGKKPRLVPPSGPHRQEPRPLQPVAVPITSHGLGLYSTLAPHGIQSNTEPGYGWQRVVFTHAQDRSDLKIDRDVFKNKKPRTYPGLPDCVKNYLSKFFEKSLLDAITWDQGVPFYVPIDAAAFTLDDHIYFGPGSYNPLNGIQEDEIILIAHEVTHSRQYRENGSLRQKARYLSESAAQGIVGTIEWNAGMGFALSYYGNKYEKEAYDLDKKVRDDLIKNGNPCKK